MIDQVISHINEQAAARVDQLCDFLRVPSISTDPDRKGDLLSGADWVKKQFESAGMQVDIVDTPGHPCVIADSGPADGDGPTILVYGHYDVQPAGDESLWDSPPFEPTIRDGAIYARGSADDKGQVMTHVFAAQSWLAAAGKLPIRIKFVIEGEEEIGSPNLGKILQDHKDRLACD
ncbi:MAG: M20/M25/M40 family metallo-hydrolase, partial [Phycisphaerae bacterium]